MYREKCDQDKDLIVSGREVEKECTCRQECFKGQKRKEGTGVRERKK